mgnify:FL=1
MIRYSLYHPATLSLTPGQQINGFSFDHINREMLFANHWSDFPEEYSLEGHSTKLIRETGVYMVQAYDPSVIELPGMTSIRFPTNPATISNISAYKLQENNNVLNRASRGFQYLPIKMGQPVGVFIGEMMLLSPVTDNQVEPNYLLKILTNHGVKWVVRPVFDY